MADIQTAWDAYLRGDAHEALKITTAMAKDDPEDAGAWYVMSRALDGERADLFYRKALSLDVDVAGRFSGAGDATLVDSFDSSAVDATEAAAVFEGEAIPTTFLDDDPAEGVMEDQFSDEAAPDFFAVPDVRPEVAPLETAAAPEPAATNRVRPKSGRRQGTDWNMVGLIVVGLLIVLVLYLLINTLIGGV